MSTDSSPADSSDDSGLYPRATLREVYYTLLKHRWPAVAVVLATWLVGGLARFMETPVYRAASLIQIDGGRINVVEDVMVNPTRGMADIYGTQEKIITSRLLAERVVERHASELIAHPLFARPSGSADPKAIARSIQGMVDVRRIEKTQLMEVSFVTPDPGLAANLANWEVEEYRNFNINSERDQAQDTSDFIHDEVTQLRDQIRKNEDTLRQFAKDQSIVVGDKGDDNIVMKRLETLNLQLTDAEAQRAAAEARYRSLQRSDGKSIEEVRNSTAVRELERNYMTLGAKYEEMSSTFGPDWPEMKRVKNAMEEVRRSLDAKVKEEARKVISAANASYHEALDREDLIRQSLDEQKSRVQDLQGASAEYNQIKAELENERQMLQGLLRRRSETSISADLADRLGGRDQEEKQVTIKVIEKADVPSAPFAPGSRRRSLMIVLLGLVLGVGTAYVIDHWDDSIHTVEDLKRYVPLPYLGMIPRYGEKAPIGGQIGRALGRGDARIPAALPVGGRSIDRALASKRSNYLPTLYDHNPSLAENRNTLSERFRFLRGSMLLSTPGAVPKVVLVTSPDKSCGKTFVSSNLSCALVQLNKRVLLIDSDLRNPKLHRVFHYRNRIGLTNVLTGQKSLGDGCIMRTDIANLFLMMAGPKSPNPGELLASPAMGKTLAEASEHFDFVILDSAPLLPVFDSHILSTRCDAVILVARAGVTSRHATLQSLEMIERVNGKITGIVLNDVNLDDYAQYYYHSHYTYEYGRYPSEDERVRMG
jgi:polysaccharide biosynthesis transport protein